MMKSTIIFVIGAILALVGGFFFFGLLIGFVSTSEISLALLLGLSGFTAFLSGIAFMLLSTGEH